MKNYINIRIIVAVAGILGLAGVTRAQIVVAVDRNVGPAINKEFRFKVGKVAPMKDDAAAKAKLKLLSGEADPESGDLNVLIDGELPAKDDDAKANFFFANGSGGGRFVMDLGEAIDIRQVNSYSWHSGSRAPQVYMLYASDGSAPHFCAETGADADPTAVCSKILTPAPPPHTTRAPAPHNS